MAWVFRTRCPTYVAIVYMRPARFHDIVTSVLDYCYYSGRISFPPPRSSKSGITSRALTHSNMCSNMYSMVRGGRGKKGEGALFVCLFQNNYPREHSTGKRTNEMEKNKIKRQK